MKYKTLRIGDKVHTNYGEGTIIKMRNSLFQEIKESSTSPKKDDVLLIELVRYGSRVCLDNTEVDIK